MPMACESRQRFTSDSLLYAVDFRSALREAPGLDATTHVF
jgi:hypothetical protein